MYEYEVNHILPFRNKITNHLINEVQYTYSFIHLLSFLWLTAHEYIQFRFVVLYWWHLKRTPFPHFFKVAFFFSSIALVVIRELL